MGPSSSLEKGLENGHPGATENGHDSASKQVENSTPEQVENPVEKDTENAPDSGLEKQVEIDPIEDHGTGPENGHEETPEAAENSTPIWRITDPLTDLEESVFGDPKTLRKELAAVSTATPLEHPKNPVRKTASRSPAIANTSSQNRAPNQQHTNGRDQSDAGEDANGAKISGKKPSEGRPHDASLEPSEDPSPYWGLPRRRPVLDYTAPELPATAPVVFRELLIALVAAVATFAAAVLGPRIMPEPVAEILSGVRFLEIVGTIANTQVFPPLAALTVATIFILILTYQRRDLRNVRSGKP